MTNDERLKENAQLVREHDEIIARKTDRAEYLKNLDEAVDEAIIDIEEAAHAVKRLGFLTVAAKIKSLGDELIFETTAVIKAETAGTVTNESD